MLETKFYFNEMKLLSIMSELDHGLRKGKNLCRAEPIAGCREIVLLIPCCGVEYCRVSVSPDLLIMCSGAAAGLLTQREDTGYCLMINWTHLAIIICSANLLTLHVLNGSVFTLSKSAVSPFTIMFLLISFLGQVYLTKRNGTNCKFS